MKNSIYIIAALFSICTSALYSQETVQAGIFRDADSLVIKAKPNLTITDKNHSGGNITIKWDENYNVTLGAVRNIVGSWSVQSSGNYNGFDYVVLGWAAGTVANITWSANVEYEIFRIAVNQTGSGTGTFSLTQRLSSTPINGENWYFEVGGLDFTNNTSPFYQQDVNNVPIPVELNSFNLNVIKNTVQLNWTTATETDNYGFEIERKFNGMNIQSWTKIGFIPGAGNSHSTKVYSFTDSKINLSGKYSYRLKQIDIGGSFTYSELRNTEIILPLKFELSQNYPNPFNPTTTINYVVANAGIVEIIIYNALGEKVHTVVNETKEPGYYSVVIDAAGFSSGIYFYRMTSGNFVKINKMTLLR